MNAIQKEKLSDIFLNEILDSEELRTTIPLEIRVFSNPDSTKIPFEIRSGEILVGLFVVDYFNQKVLPECSGYNGDENSIKINCEDYFKGFEYDFDEDLTEEYNQRFARKV